MKLAPTLTLLAPLAAALVGCSPSSPESTAPHVDAPGASVARIEVAESAGFARDREPLVFPYYDLGLPLDDARIPALVAREGDAVLPSQSIDHDGDGTPDSLLVVADFAPGQTRALHVVADPAAAAARPSMPKQTQAEISHKTGGEWQGAKYVGGTFQNVERLSPPSQYTDHSEWIRYEGPGIESDKVGYRIYLDWRNGFDIFGKKTPAMVLHHVGLDGYQSYHEPADWGMDVLKVGQSLGAGGYGFWNGSAVELVSKVDQREVTIVENGPLYSALRIDYRGWQIDGKKLDLAAHLAMHAGSRLVHARLDLSAPLRNLAIGFVKHPGVELVQGTTETSGYAWTYVGTWGKQSLSGPDDMLGMAVIFRRGDRQRQVEDASSHVSVMQTAGGRVEYYFLAAWDGEPGGIKTRDEFVAYLEREVKRLTVAPRIRLENALSAAAKSFPTDAAAALEWSRRLADSELERKTLLYHADGWDTNRRRVPNFEYDIIGLQPMAYDELATLLPEARFKEVPHKITGSFITAEGGIRGYDLENFNIDAIKPGRVVLRLWEQTRDERYRKAADLLRRQLAEHPRTSEGAFWHKRSYPHQLWLDGVYMGMPFLAHYSVLFEDGHSLEEVVKEFTVTRERLRDPQTGLYYHAWDESKQMNWADDQTGLSGWFWGRGLGWLSMAIVDVLDFIPADREDLRRPLLEMAAELAPALRRVQDPDTGTWWQILDHPGRVGNYRESTASAMFAYFFAKGVRMGYLPDEYAATAQKAYDGLIAEFVTVHPDGRISMTNQCLVAGLGFGRDGSYDYYMSERVFANDPKGNGPFILAGIEFHRLLAARTP
jgi:rhamnogalacturonyl hydrolase YesR